MPVREDAFLPTTGPGVTPRTVGVAELLRRLGEAEAKLATSERDRAADAELIGNLLGEIADRDRRVRALEARTLADAEQLAALETRLAAGASQSVAGDGRTAELEDSLKRTGLVFAEVLRRLNESRGGEPDLSELHDLLAVALSALDLTRAVGAETARKLEDTRAAMANVGAHHVEHALGATHDRARHVLSVSIPLDRAIARVVERLREIERRENELDDLRGELLSESAALIASVQSLRDAMGALARRPGSVARMRKPAKLPDRA